MIPLIYFCLHLSTEELLRYIFLILYLLPSLISPGPPVTHPRFTAFAFPAAETAFKLATCFFGCLGGDPTRYTGLIGFFSCLKPSFPEAKQYISIITALWKIAHFTKMCSFYFMAWQNLWLRLQALHTCTHEFFTAHTLEDKSLCSRAHSFDIPLTEQSP